MMAKLNSSFPDIELTKAPTRNVASRLQLFFDEWLIDEMNGVDLRLHNPIPREALFDLNRPWEGPASGVGLVTMKEDDGYHMWYVGFTEGDRRRTGYAVSEDGVHWERPNRGLIEYDGSKENNLVMEPTVGHNLCPFRDDNPRSLDADQYKAISKGVGRDDGRATQFGFTSPDLLHWKPLDENPILVAPGDEPFPHFDSPNVAFWDAEREHYVAYMRGFLPPGYRSIRRSVSLDFRTWSKPEFINMGDSPPEQLYTNACTPYFRAPHIYVMFPNRYVPERTPFEKAKRVGISETVFMASRDGVNWDRRFMETFIRPGPDFYQWHKHSTMVGTGLFPTGPTEMSLYYVEHHGHPSVRLRRATLRTDGFVSVSSNYGGGEFITKTFTFTGNELAINYATSVGGTLRMEIQDGDGVPIEGYEASQSQEIYGDEIEHVVTWQDSSNVGALERRQVRLRFVMSREVDLYSLQFRNAQQTD